MAVTSSELADTPLPSKGLSSAFSSGYITVTAANACGQNDTLKPRIYPVNVKPAAPAAISGTASGICSGTQVYSIAAVAGATGYQWTVPAGVSIVSGQGTSTLSVSVSSTFQSGEVCVTAVNNCGSSSQTCLPVNGIPAAPLGITGALTACFKEKNADYSTPAV